RSLLAGLSLFCLAPSAVAGTTPASGEYTSQEAEQANVLLTSPVVVTATRQEQNSFDLPVSIDVVDAATIHDAKLQVNISEDLPRVPGVVAQFRGQYAQDLQISTRGFGARSQFGVRGIRLYSDGIPLTMPDGQGQTGTMDLLTAERIEVMRGPFSALYGNSSGGVLQIFTADGPKNPTVDAAFMAGSYDTQREAIKVGGTEGALNYNAGLSHLESDDYRDHASVRRTLFNTKLGLQVNEDTRLTVLGTYLDQPEAQDPLSLNKDQWEQDPKQAGIGAENFNTRVIRRHTQVGAKLEHDFDADNTIHLMAYGGNRFNEQFQAVGANPSGTGITSAFLKNLPPNANNQTAGGGAQIQRNFGGTDLHYTHKGLLAGNPYSFTVGANYDTQTDDRTGFDNFLAIPGTGNNRICGVGVVCGVKGILRRDEDNKVWDFDQYAQGEWSPHERWNLFAGVRHSDVHFENDDKYLYNGNSSGKVSHEKTTPVAGVLFKVTPMLNLYANAGKGFETPTLVEMAYKPGGIGTFNLDLQPSTSDNYEVGAKAYLGADTRANVAFFHIDTNDEIVVSDTTNGRSSYQNAASTRRQGVEVSIDSDFGYGFTGYASYAYLNAEYSSSFCNASTASNCAGGTLVQSGKTIPGTYSDTAYAELAWKYAPSGFSTALEARAYSQVYVADTNNDTAPGYALMSWRGGFNQNIRQWRMSEFVRVDNLFDREYVGSVKLNDSNQRYYESGSNRNWLLGLNASYQF
ncbi:MAG TPA: TonB-dependent receptor, partial [Methylophilaceae bacterium]|nr:TonB-dependent receptor [Methylophilaceae bacterium]